ncbi:uncharacterized protein VTP21DRAFT_1023 [Calcarisporiella thermophila]|uniref:uncharacterized protein n=1 Tax=Calcarisporiella thermophila TaxID=911321 RepID=UPI003743EB3D
MPDNDGNSPPPNEEEIYSSWALLILTSLLSVALFTSYWLQLKKVRAVHETVISIFAGMFVGMLLRVTPGSIIQNMVTFKHAYFFNLLLPPIILNSGYELKRETFFRNLGAILTFAFVGTFISAIVIGLLAFILSLTNLENMKLTLLDSMIFGSTLSATDPVTVLAIFSQLKVDANLYAIIFGESILNDAVAIVLSETFNAFRGHALHFTNIMLGIGTFLWVFMGSLAIGLLFGMAVALMLKYTRLHEFPSIESCIISLISYSSYLFSNGCKLSGIVSLLFCGITLKHYATENMSLRTRRTIEYTFQILAQMAENFVFIYLGLTLFTQSDLDFKPLFSIFTFVFVCIARYCAVFPLAKLLNLISRSLRGPEILPRAHVIMLFWSGLRGAVAFALTTGLKGGQSSVCLIVVVLTVIVFGGTVSRMLVILGIPTGVQEEDNSDDDYRYSGENDPEDRERLLDEEQGHGRRQSGASHQSEEGQNGVLGQKKRHWFLSFDDHYLKPLFTKTPPNRTRQDSSNWDTLQGTFNEDDIDERGITLHDHPPYNTHYSDGDRFDELSAVEESSGRNLPHGNLIDIS